MLRAEADRLINPVDTTSYVQDWGSGLSRIIQQTSNGTTAASAAVLHQFTVADLEPVRVAYMIYMAASLSY